MAQGQIQTFDPTKQRPVVPSNLVVVVNAVDVTVKFAIGGFPGQPETLFVLAPGEQAMLPASYAQPIRGSGREQRESVLMMMTGVEAYPGGPRIQTVVPMDDAEATRKRWDEAKANRPRVATVMLHDQSGNPVPLAIPTVHTEPAAPPAKDKGKG